MRISKYSRSLRLRITLAITSLALISAVIYSIFSWLIYEISDDRLFNWYVMSINKQAIEEQVIPQSSPNSFSVIGNEAHLTQELISKFSIKGIMNEPLELHDVFEITHISHYPGQHRIIDLEYEEKIFELQIVASPWNGRWLYVVYDISSYESSIAPNNLWSDSFVLLVLIPLALLVGVLAFFLSIGLTQTILKPLINLANEVSSVTPEQLSKPLSKHYYPDEVGDLAITFNLFILRIEKYIENEKRFSREVSHELRTPTTSLSIAVELLETTTLDNRQNQLLARIKRANDDMIRLIKTFLWLAKTKSEKGLEENINLFSFTNQVVEKLEYLKNKKPITITNNICIKQKLLINPALLDIVITNLIRNALQYTIEGDVLITSTHQSITIVDTGLGIPIEEIKNIEQAFYSLQPDGIGLGLSIVQRVIVKLGWKLQIESQEQKGTKISLLFE